MCFLFSLDAHDVEEMIKYCEEMHHVGGIAFQQGIEKIGKGVKPAVTNNSANHGIQREPFKEVGDETVRGAMKESKSC